MDPNFEAARRVGTTLCHKWTLERLIGTGGMAAVYVAVHKIGRREAIKILHPDIAAEPELRARFEQEAEAVNRFKHPGAVEIRDIDVAEDGSPFLVMELLEGDSLNELARKGNGVPIPELLRLMDELCDVLTAAHAQGIVHRDIKPDNLFVMRDGRLKVLDFGIARVRAGASFKLNTRVGATLGTAPYMPPEQIKGQEIDARADIFAVGATMFRLIARRRIHETNNETETLVKMASEPAPPLLKVAPEAPLGVGLIVDRALQFDRARRYPDAATMQADIRAVRAGGQPPFATARLAEGEPLSAVAGSVDVSTRRQQDPPSAFDPTMAASPMVTFPAAPLTAGSEAATRAEVAPGPHDEALEASLPMPPGQGVGATTEVMPAMAPAARPAFGGSTLQSAPLVHPPAAHGVGTAVALLANGPASLLNAGTQPSGLVPFGYPGGPMAPGGTIPVVNRSAFPQRSESQVGVVPIILVGVAFAALGVGLTLFFMLRRPEPVSASAPTSEPAATEPQPEPERRQPLRPPHSPYRPPQPAQPPPQREREREPSMPPGFPPVLGMPTSSPAPGPQNPGGSRDPSPGKGHGKGHGK